MNRKAATAMMLVLLMISISTLELSLLTPIAEADPTLTSFGGVSSNGRSFGISTETSEDGNEGGYARVAVDDAGGVYVIWASLFSREIGEGVYLVITNYIFFTYSHDNGKTWSQDIKINDGGGPTVYCDDLPSIEVDQRNGHVYVAWADNRTGDWNVYVDKSTDRGRSFGSDVKVNDNIGSMGAAHVNVAVTSDGEVYVAWADPRRYSGGGRSDIYFASSMDGALTFSSNVRVTPDQFTQCNYPWIAVDKEGAIYIVYTAMRHVYLSKSMDGGLSFGAPVKVDDDALEGYRGKKEIAVTRSGKIHVVWTDGRPPTGTSYMDTSYWDIYFATSSDGGLSFGPNVRVNDDPFGTPTSGSKTAQGTPSLAIDRDEGIHVVWEDFRNYESSPNYVRDTYYAFSKDGSRFTKNVRINYAPDASRVDCADPNIAMDSRDNLFIVWSDAPYVEPQLKSHIYFAFSSGWTWTKFHHDLGNTGFSTSTAPKTNFVRWIYGTYESVAVESSPAVADGMVFFGSGNSVYALTETIGELVWLTPTGGLVKSSPAVADGLVFVGSYDNAVYALDEMSGTIVWKRITDGPILSSPAVVDGMVFIGSTDFNVYALNETTGQLVWSFPTESSVVHSPAVVDGLVFTGSESKMYALNETTGSRVWESAYAVRSSPTVADGMVFFGSDQGICALNEADGTLVWNIPTGAAVYSTPAVSHGKLFFGCENNYIYALKIADQSLAWSYATSGTVRSSPAVADGVVFVGSSDHNLYALDETDGQLVWVFAALGEVRSSPAIAYGSLFAGSADGNVYAFGPRHNIAVRSVASSKTVIGQGYSTLITLTLENLGNAIETFYVDLQYDGLIDSFKVTLAPQVSTTQTIQWNTLGIRKGLYTIKAHAWPVPSETNTADNTYTDGTVLVTIPGDINGDRVVNSMDSKLLKLAFGSKPGDSNWNPKADINDDGIVNNTDKKILTHHMGQSW